MEKRASGIMRCSLPPEVDAECSMEELVHIFVQSAKNRKKDLTVIVKYNHFIVGMINRSDLLNILEPSYTKGALKVEFFWEGLLSEIWSSVARTKVKDFMRPVAAVNASDNLMKVAHVMNSTNTDTVLVIEGNKPVGSILVEDLLAELTGDYSKSLGSKRPGVVTA